VLSNDDLGHRVVVRRVVGERDGRPLMTDVLGELTRYGEHDLTVETKTGPKVVPFAEIVAAKRIPPRITRPAGGKAADDATSA
jgi:N-acetylglutamate synthase